MDRCPNRLGTCIGETRPRCHRAHRIANRGQLAARTVCTRFGCCVSCTDHRVRTAQASDGLYACRTRARHPARRCRSTSQPGCERRESRSVACSERARAGAVGGSAYGVAASEESCCRIDGKRPNTRRQTRSHCEWSGRARSQWSPAPDVRSLWRLRRSDRRHGFQSRHAASAARLPNTSANARTNSPSRSAREIDTPNASSEVTPCSRMPQGTISENASKAVVWLKAKP